MGRVRRIASSASSSQIPQRHPSVTMRISVAIVASVAVNVILCVGLFTATMSSSNLGAAATRNVAAPRIMNKAAFSRATIPATTSRSAVNAYEEPDAMKTLSSYMPGDYGEVDIANQVNYMIQQGLIPCIEFDKSGFLEREHNRMTSYYDNRYWTMWKLPMFGATDARFVLAEIAECKRSNPRSFIRVLGFDNIQQVQRWGGASDREAWLPARVLHVPS